MTQNLIVEFTKWAGAGNDFIALDNRFYALGHEELPALARHLCDRSTGIGADGLLLLSVDGDPFGASGQPAQPRMTIYNADGSRPTMCGNGARCLARHAAEAGLADEQGETHVLTLATDAGPVGATVEGQRVTLELPDAHSFRRLTVDELPVRSVWTGTEHAVVFTSDLPGAPALDEVDVARLGARLRRDAVWGRAGTNVSFAEPVGEGRVAVRTFEKGVEAETQACGTGALAVALALADREAPSGAAPRVQVEVETRGGTLIAGFDRPGRDFAAAAGLTLTGPAVRVFRGTFELGRDGFAAG
jgi:diaminopimelate epimerase